MILKTLGTTTWDKIKIGEVFAHDSGWQIYVKTEEDEAVLLEGDEFQDQTYIGKFRSSKTKKGRFDIASPWKNYFKEWLDRNGRHVYKLPKSVQELWLK